MNTRANGLWGMILILLFLAPTAFADVIEDFSSVPAGTVVAGDMPGGGTDPGTHFTGFTLTVTNNDDGPSSGLIFDSSNPTGGDEDLGTPNIDFGGPGIGSGGGNGMPGVNDQSWGNLLICADNITDANNDNLVDDPNDEAGGSTFVFEFDQVVDLKRIVFVDIDSESVQFNTFEFGVFIAGDEGVDLGNNSVQVVDLTPMYSVDRLEVVFSSSGAIAELEFADAVVPVDQSTWGGVKALFRD